MGRLSRKDRFVLYILENKMTRVPDRAIEAISRSIMMSLVVVSSTYSPGFLILLFLIFKT